jgi:hypothetical protein
MLAIPSNPPTSTHQASKPIETTVKNTDSNSEENSLDFDAYRPGKRVIHLFRGKGLVQHIDDSNRIVVKFDKDGDEHGYSREKIEQGKLTLMGATSAAEFSKRQRIYHHSHGPGTVSAVVGKEVVFTFGKGKQVRYNDEALSTGKVRILDAERYASVDYTATGFFVDLQSQIDDLQSRLQLGRALREQWDYETCLYLPKPLELVMYGYRSCPYCRCCCSY